MALPCVLRGLCPSRHARRTLFAYGWIQGLNPSTQNGLKDQPRLAGRAGSGDPFLLMPLSTVARLAATLWYAPRGVLRGTPFTHASFVLAQCQPQEELRRLGAAPSASTARLARTRQIVVARQTGDVSVAILIPVGT